MVYCGTYAIHVMRIYKKKDMISFFGSLAAAAPLRLVFDNTDEALALPEALDEPSACA